jgi:hypothetical protein
MASPDPREPGDDIGVGGVQRLADEIDPVMEQDIGEREARRPPAALSNG